MHYAQMAEDIDKILSIGDIRWHWQWKAFKKLPSLFRMVPSLTSYDLPFLQYGVPNAPWDQIRDACCHLANIIEDIDKISLHTTL